MVIVSFCMVRVYACSSQLTSTQTSADLYGRGYSDAPEITYDTSLYATQLALLMQHVKWPKAHVAGVSMVRGFMHSVVITVDQLSRSYSGRRYSCSVHVILPRSG